MECWIRRAPVPEPLVGTGVGPPRSMGGAAEDFPASDIRESKICGNENGK